MTCSPCSAACRTASVMASACSEVSLAAVNARAMAWVSNTGRCYHGAHVAERLARANRARYEVAEVQPDPGLSAAGVRRPLESDAEQWTQRGSQARALPKNLPVCYQWVTRYPYRSSRLRIQFCACQRPRQPPCFCFEHAPGDIGEGGNTLDPALVGQWVCAGTPQAAAGAPAAGSEHGGALRSSDSGRRAEPAAEGGRCRAGAARGGVLPGLPPVLPCRA